MNNAPIQYAIRRTGTDKYHTGGTLRYLRSFSVAAPLAKAYLYRSKGAAQAIINSGPKNMPDMEIVEVQLVVREKSQ